MSKRVDKPSVLQNDLVVSLTSLNGKTDQLQKQIGIKKKIQNTNKTKSVVNYFLNDWNLVFKQKILNLIENRNK